MFDMDRNRGDEADYWLHRNSDRGVLSAGGAVDPERFGDSSRENDAVCARVEQGKERPA